MSISIIGLSSSYFVPGTFTQLNFAAGSSGGGGSPAYILLMGNCTAASFVNTNSLFDGYVFGPDALGNLSCSSESDVKSLFGSGSELHLQYREVAKSNAGATPIYLIAVKESTGAAASKTVTFTNAATGAGTVRTYIGKDFIDTAVASGDATTAIATNVANSINSLDYLGVTASPSTSTVVITAKQKGLRGNSIRVAVQVVGSIATTSSAQNFSNLTGGTVADVWTNALATIFPLRFRYIACAGEDSTSSGDLGLLTAQLATQALPLNGIRQICFGGSTGTVGAANTAANNLNSVYARLIWEQNSNKTPAQLAAYTAGAVALAESSGDPTDSNFNYLGTDTKTAALWSAAAPYDGTTVSNSNINSALTSGVSPVVRRKFGTQSTLVQLVTTYSKNPVTSALDTRSRDHIVTTSMFVAADRIEAMLTESFSRSTCAQDPPAGQKPPTSSIVTPSVVLTAVNKVIYDLGQDGWLEDVQSSIDNTFVELQASGRFAIRVQLNPIGITNQFGILLSQLS